MPPYYDAPIVQFPVPGYTRFLARGGTSVLAIPNNGKQVLKFPLALEIKHCNSQDAAVARSQMEESHIMLEREKEIYQHLGSRPSILAPLEISPVGIFFPFLENGDLRAYLQNKWNEIKHDQLIVWEEEAVDQICFTQSMDVYQCDISARNFLVDDDLSLVLGDFSGLRLGDKEELVGPEISYEKLLRDDQ